MGWLTQTKRVKPITCEIKYEISSRGSKNMRKLRSCSCKMQNSRSALPMPKDFCWELKELQDHAAKSRK